MPITAFAEGEPTTTVIPDGSYPLTITAPVGGATIADASLASANDYFTVTSTQWAVHGSQTYLAPGSSFGYETTYVATVTLTPKTGYEFGDGNPYYTASNFYTSAFNASKEGDNLIILINFPQTGSSPFIIPAPIFGSDYIPVPGAIAETTVTGEGYSGTISWSPALESGGTFGYGTVYAATVSLNAASQDLPFPTGASSVGVFNQSGGTVSGVTNTGAALTFTVTFPQTATLRKINYLGTLANFDSPEPGETPESITNATTATFTTAYNDRGYTVTGLSWSGTMNDGKFDYEETYTATFTLTANQGYVFESTNEITSAYFFEDGTPTITGNTGNVLTVTITFTTGSLIITIDEFDRLTGLAAPQVHNAPEELGDIDDDYSAFGYTATALSWEGTLDSDGMFDYSTVYTAYVTLTPIGDYYFDDTEGFYDDLLSSFHQYATSAENGELESATKLIVTITFPATASKTPIAVTALQGFDSPVALAYPDTEVTTNYTDSGYTLTIGWANTDINAQFDYGTDYTATFVLTAEDEYTFANNVNLTNFIPGKTPTVISNTGSVLTFTVTFTTNSRTPVTLQPIVGLT
ncbi:MAG: hypothetical protein LBM87_06300, partial [Ruminococcus sp.]|nr:hypothetical protein [Ruminococcus sp.]